MSSDRPAIAVRGLSKRYEIYATPRDRLKQLVLPRVQSAFQKLSGRAGVRRRREPLRYFHEFWALRDVSFEVRPGETFGIIGRNGSGKSTLLQIIAGTLAHTTGNVEVNGRVAALLELGSGFNPEFSGRDNVFLNGRILGLTEREIEARYDRIVAFADIGEFIDQPVKTYSSGMFVRLAFAVQAHVDASIVIIDEALAVGDVFFAQKCYTRLEELRKNGAAVVLVSHSMPDIEQYCERALLLDHGFNRFLGPASEATKHYYLLHRTHALPRVPAPDSGSSITAGPDATQPVPRPETQAFFDLRAKPQIGTGMARCAGVALLDEHGVGRRVFRQGETAIFYYEFDLEEDVPVPIVGLVISNSRGVIVHGKNNWQFRTDVPPCTGPKARVQCRHSIKLDLAPGQYVFEVGLAAVSVRDWQRRDRISHDEIDARFERICHVPSAGSFGIGLADRDGVAVLTHHGVADLPGSIDVHVSECAPVADEPSCAHG